MRSIKIDTNLVPAKFIFSPEDDMVFLLSWIPYPSLIIDLISGEVKSQIQIEDAFPIIFFEKDLVISPQNGGHKFFKLSTGEELLTLYDIGEDWAVTTPSGLFDASPGAFEKMYYVQGLDIIDFEQIKDKYWEPGLYEKVMKGKQLRSVETIDRKLDLWPEITELLFKENYEKLQISLENQGGGIGKVQVFLNGKEILNDARDGGITPSQQFTKITVNLKDHPLLINGENHVEVMTWNESGTLSSKRERAEFLVDKQVNLPEIYLVAVGISDYQGEAIDLKYAAKDASDFMTAAGIAAKNLFTAERTHGYLLTTDKDNQRKPTKKEIVKTFDEITRTAKPEDVVVLYLAGHGLNLGGENGDLHYLTMDAFSPNPAIYNDPSIKEMCTISGAEIVDLLSKVPALKQVFIIDACSAGKLVDNLIIKRDIEASIVKALERMKDRAGLHIITGSAADAVSYEASKFGQGLLTYSLLAGIKGLALKNNLTVDVALLMQHAREMVPKLAQGIGGIQEPRIFSPKGAESFDIGLVTDNDKVLIPLAEEKQIFIQSNLQDFNELSDVLGLSELIDEQFTKLSENEKDAPFIFWAVRSYPEAKRISGGYSVDGDQIEVRFKIFKDKTGGETITVSGLRSNLQDIVNQVITLAVKSMAD